MMGLIIALVLATIVATVSDSMEEQQAGVSIRYWVKLLAMIVILVVMIVIIIRHLCWLYPCLCHQKHPSQKIVCRITNYE